MKPAYAEMGHRRLHGDRPLFADVQVVSETRKAAAAD